jgi:hypothetical protein
VWVTSSTLGSFFYSNNDFIPFYWVFDDFTVLFVKFTAYGAAEPTVDAFLIWPEAALVAGCPEFILF